MYYELEIDLVNGRATLRGSRGVDLLRKKQMLPPIRREDDQPFNERDVLEYMEHFLRERGEEINQVILQPDSTSYFWIHTKSAPQVDRKDRNRFGGGHP